MKKEQFRERTRQETDPNNKYNIRNYLSLHKELRRFQHLVYSFYRLIQVKGNFQLYLNLFRFHNHN